MSFCGIQSYYSSSTTHGAFPVSVDQWSRCCFGTITGPGAVPYTVAFAATARDRFWLRLWLEYRLWLWLWLDYRLDYRLRFIMFGFIPF